MESKYKARIAEKLLELSEEAMKRNRDKLEYLFNKWAGTGRGIERWFQIELMYQMQTGSDLEFELNTEGGPKGPDLKVKGSSRDQEWYGDNDFLVELKCPTIYDGQINAIIEGFNHEPEPHVVLFLTMLTKELENLVYKYIVRATIIGKWSLGYLIKKD